MTNPFAGSDRTSAVRRHIRRPTMKPHTQRSGAVTISTRQKRIRYAMLTHMTVACAVGPCNEPRIDGTSYCAKHGPKTGRAKPGKSSDKSGAAQMVCPHCQVRGQVHTKRVKVKRGISGGKATGAVLTAGFSILATGLSRKEAATQATCNNCRVTWMI